MLIYIHNIQNNIVHKWHRAVYNLSQDIHKITMVLLKGIQG